MKIFPLSFKALFKNEENEITSSQYNSLLRQVLLQLFNKVGVVDGKNDVNQ